MNHTLRIEHTWDGQPLTHTELVELSYQITETGSLEVQIDSPFHGDPAPSVSPGSCWELWEYEVVELFLVGENGHYLELEFGPHGHYLALLLDGPRSVIRSQMTLTHNATVSDTRWRSHSIVPKDLLPTRIVKHNAFAIHGQGQERRYLAHSPLPGPKADFHQPQRFADC